MIRLVFLTAVLTFLVACRPEESVWTQRTTLSVETPSGIVTGSSIVEVMARSCEGGCGRAGDVEVNYSYRGEAVALEVLPDQWLFALIGNPAALMYVASPDQFGGIPRHERGEWLAATPRQTETVELLTDYAPTLMAFEDITDRSSAHELNWNDLTAVFSNDVRLVSVSLAVTNDPFVNGSIRSILPYLGKYPEIRLVTEIVPRNPSFTQSLRTGWFVRQERA